MANVDRPSGARPVNIDGSGFNASLRQYEVKSGTNTNDIFPGDFVAQAADGSVVPASAGAGNSILGVVTSVEYDNDVAATEYPGYLPSATDGSVLVAMAEDTYFSIQEDSDAGALGESDRGDRANFIANSGSAITGLSKHEIDSSSAGAGATGQLQLVRKVESPDNDYGDKCEWVVQVNLPQNATGTAGV